MASFSEREGIIKRKTIAQFGAMDSELRTALWNCLMANYFELTAQSHTGSKVSQTNLTNLCRQIWVRVFKLPIDEKPIDWRPTFDALKSYFFRATWAQVYDFVEFVPKNFSSSDSTHGRRFRGACNAIFVQEVSGYRFIGTEIVPISNELEVEAVETAMSQPTDFENIAFHIRNAVHLLSDKTAPDYRNSIKEAISAVEAMATLVAGLEKPDLDKALDIIATDYGFHTAFKRSLSSLFGYTSDAEGIRHALMDRQTLSYDDAKFMVVSCSTFVNYLRALKG